MPYYCEATYDEYLMYMSKISTLLYALNSQMC